MTTRCCSTCQQPGHYAPTCGRLPGKRLRRRVKALWEQARDKRQREQAKR